MGNDFSNGQASTSASGLTENTMAFSSRQSSCSRQLPDIAEDGNESLEEETCGDRRRNLRNDNNGSNNNTDCYMPNFTNDFWDGPSFNGTKTANDNDELMFTTTSNGFETQVHNNVCTFLSYICLICFLKTLRNYWFKM